MDFQFTRDQLEIQNWAKKFAEEFLSPLSALHGREKIKKGILEKLSSEGFMTLTVPESLGGLELDAISFSVVIEELSKVCGSVGVTVAVTNMIADILVREGAAYHHEKYLRALVRGESLTASFCLTENSSGSDASSLKTSAKKIPGGYEITGEKIFVTNGAFSNVFLVMAKTEAGVSSFLVDRNLKGLHIGSEEDKCGLVGSSTVRLSLEQVKVKEEDRLGPEGAGFKVALRALDGGRISVSAQALGIGSAALEAGIQYAKEREQFGKPISEFQAIQWKIADAATKLSAARYLVYRAAYLKSVRKPITLEASMAKVFTTEVACHVCEDMLQIHGGYGYIKDYPIERLMRDVRVTTLYEGTSEIQRMVIAKRILGSDP